MRKREAGFRVRAPPDVDGCRGLRPKRHRFVESIIHEAFPPSLLLAPLIAP